MMNKKIRGVTLIEMVMVIVLLSILSVVGGTMISDSFMAGKTVSDNLTASAHAQYAMTRMADEIREARSATASDLTISATDSLTFTNNDGDSVTYNLSSGNLMQGSNALSDNVSGLTFAYLDGSEAETTDVTDVRCIKVDATFSAGDSNIPVTTTVCPRNFGL